jgi:hypothetical protein
MLLLIFSISFYAKDEILANGIELHNIETDFILMDVVCPGG